MASHSPWKWDQVGVNFSGSSGFMKNALTGYSSAGTIFDDITKNLETERQNDIVNQQDQQRINLLQNADQREADKFARAIQQDEEGAKWLSLYSKYLPEYTDKNGIVDQNALNQRIYSEMGTFNFASTGNLGYVANKDVSSQNETIRHQLASEATARMNAQTTAARLAHDKQIYKDQQTALEEAQNTQARLTAIQMFNPNIRNKDTGMYNTDAFVEAAVAANGGSLSPRETLALQTMVNGMTGSNTDTLKALSDAQKQNLTNKKTQAEIDKLEAEAALKQQEVLANTGNSSTTIGKINQNYNSGKKQDSSSTPMHLSNLDFNPESSAIITNALSNLRQNLLNPNNPLNLLIGENMGSVGEVYALTQNYLAKVIKRGSYEYDKDNKGFKLAAGVEDKLTEFSQGKGEYAMGLLREVYNNSPRDKISSELALYASLDFNEKEIQTYQEAMNAALTDGKNWVDANKDSKGKYEFVNTDNYKKQFKNYTEYMSNRRDFTPKVFTPKDPYESSPEAVEAMRDGYWFGTGTPTTMLNKDMFPDTEYLSPNARRGFNNLARATGIDKYWKF